MTSLDIIYLSITGVSLLFSAYLYFRDPITALQKQQAIDSATDQGKANVLAQQFADEKEVNQRRFTEMGTKLDNAMTLAQNHIHTLDVKLDRVAEQLNSMNISFTKSIEKVTTIMEERLPHK